MLTGRRYETFTVHSVVQNFRTSDCDWLMPHAPGLRTQTRVSLTDSLKRRELLEEFLFWYFDSFLIPLLKVRSWILMTETATHVINRTPSISQNHKHSAIRCYIFGRTTGTSSAGLLWSVCARILSKSWIRWVSYHSVRFIQLHMACRRMRNRFCGSES